jgi:hypothetical protein
MPRSAAMWIARIPAAHRSATFAAIVPGLGVTGSRARATLASCSAAASVSATSSSISRKVRRGLGTLIRMRRVRAGLRGR